MAIDEAFLGYIAGMLDSEGSIRIEPYQNVGEGRWYYVPEMDINNSCIAALITIKERLGCGSIIYKGNHTYAFKLKAPGPMCKIVRDMYRYLIVKRRRVELLVEACEVIEKHGMFSEYAQRKLERIHYEIWRMNHVGEPRDACPETDHSYPDNPVTIGYIAGFLDGDGSIYIVRQRSRMYHMGYRYFVEVSFHNKDPCLLKTLRDLLGAGSIDCRDSRRMRLRITANTVVRDLLRRVLPLLIVRRGRAKLALKLLELQEQSGKLWKSLSRDKYNEFRKEYYSEQDRIYEIFKTLTA